MTPDYSKHIAENIAKGSTMCPFGSAFMNTNLKGQEQQQLPTNFDLYGYDPEAPDSDDEPLSDLDM